MDRDNLNKRLRVLFDSGCSATLLNKEYCRSWVKTKLKPISWSTKAGSFKTKRSCDIEFTLPAFHENRKISCTAFVDESHHSLCNYDMIIGRDLMHSLGIDLLFGSGQISWDNATIQMQHPINLKGDWIDAMEQELLFAHDPDTTDAERIQGIIESTYTPADINKIVAECSHLEKEEQKQLYKLLQKYEPLFDGSLGTWNTEPIDLELKEPNVKPFHAKPYPVPYAHEKNLKKKLKG